MDFLIEYKLKPESADDAQALRTRFFAGLKQDNDSEVVYRSLAKPDGVTFVHLAWFANQDALTRFQSTGHFKEFSSTLPDYCEDGPNATPLTEIHSTNQS